MDDFVQSNLCSEPLASGGMALCLCTFPINDGTKRAKMEALVPRRRLLVLSGILKRKGIECSVVYDTSWPSEFLLLECLAEADLIEREARRLEKGGFARKHISQEQIKDLPRNFKPG